MAEKQQKIIKKRAKNDKTYDLLRRHLAQIMGSLVSCSAFCKLIPDLEIAEQIEGIIKQIGKIREGIK